MAVTVQRQCESVVTEMYEDAFVGSSIENGTTMIPVDLRQLDFHGALGTTAPICWRKDPSHVDLHALSTFHNPSADRFPVAQGSSLNDQHQRVYFPPEIKGVSTSQPMSHSVIRLACYLAVVCGVSLRHSALLFAYARGKTAALAGPHPDDGVSHGRLLPTRYGPLGHGGQGGA
jgi:hypothetical protein